MTAAIFMTTSTHPIKPPKRKITGTAIQNEFTKQIESKLAAYSTADMMSTRRHPMRSASTPATGITSSEPMPMHRSRTPSRSSPIASRSRSTGTSGAHEAAPKPLTKKIARVAFASRSPIFVSRSPNSVISISPPSCMPPERRAKNFCHSITAWQKSKYRLYTMFSS